MTIFKKPGLGERRYGKIGNSENHPLGTRISALRMEANLMELNEVMMKRRSIRRFTDEKIQKDQLEYLLHLGMSGPSACNARPWEFYVVTQEEKITALRKVHMFSKYEAPVMIVVAGNLRRALRLQMQDFWIQDCSAAMENILLGATDMGLGACWEGLYPMKRSISRVREILGLEDEIVPLGMIAIGHPAEEQPPRDQFDSQRVHYLE